MNSIKAWWWVAKDNLGDVLTPYIIEKLTGKKCQFIGNYWLTVIRYILRQIHNHRPVNTRYLHPIYFMEHDFILCVGSILGHKNQRHAIVWGSGFQKREHIFYGKKVLAVRGKYSSDRLVELGHNKVDVLGDPALLLPIIYKPNVKKNGKVAIIPHISEYEQIKQKYGTVCDVISMNTTDVEGTIDLLCSYNYVFSSSLHGLIIGHAYGVPVVWFENKAIDGDEFHFKYRDYFSSVGISYYEPYKDIEAILNGDIVSFFDNNRDKYEIESKLIGIQRNLLNVAPFEIVNIYKSYM